MSNPRATRLIDQIRDMADHAGTPADGQVLRWSESQGAYAPTADAVVPPSLLNVDSAEIFAGQIVTTHAPDGAMVRAVSTVNKPGIGLLATDTAIGFTGQVQTFGDFTLDDWSKIVGDTFLTHGAKYFLSATAGMLTATPPANSSTGELLQLVGTAISATTLKLSLSSTILL